MREMQGSSSMPRASRRYARPQWTDERTKYLRKRWLQGARMREIAEELGRGISTNAVAAKIRRLGIAEFSPYGGAPGRRRAAKKILRRPERTSGYRGVEHRCVQRPIPAWVANARPYVENPLLDAGVSASATSHIARIERPHLQVAGWRSQQFCLLLRGEAGPEQAVLCRALRARLSAAAGVDTTCLDAAPASRRARHR